MPTYEYVCKNCGHRFDVVQSMQDEPLTVCPNCGEPQLRKVFAPPAISFKGSGFYATDHGSKSKPRGESDARKRDDASGAPAKDEPKGGRKDRSKDGKESGSRDPSSGGSTSGGSSRGSSDSSSSSSSSKGDPS